MADLKTTQLTADTAPAITDIIPGVKDPAGTPLNRKWTVGDITRVGVRKTVNAQTGTTYTPVIADENKLVTLSNASAITLTLPQDSAVAFPVGSLILFEQLGAGLVTFLAGTGATINSPAGLAMLGQYSVVQAIKTAANTWTLDGSLGVANAPLRVVINAQTGTTYTPVLADEGKLVTLSNAGAITVTMPQDSAVAIPIGGQINFTQLGAGQVTFAAGTGATVNTTPTAKTRAQYSTVTAIKRAANTWLLIGDMAAS